MPISRHVSRMVIASTAIAVAVFTSLTGGTAHAAVNDQSGGQTWGKNGLSVDDGKSPGVSLTLLNPSSDLTWKRVNRENDTPGPARDHFETRGMAVTATINGTNLCTEPDVPSCVRMTKIDRTLSWRVHLARGGNLKLGSDINHQQVVVAYNSKGIGVGGFVIPWAHDAQGRDLPTEFSIVKMSNGDWQLNQRVHNNNKFFQYPVKADPDFDWGIISGHLYFNKFETQEIVNQAFTEGAVCGVIAAVYPPAGAGCLADFGALYGVARYAVDAGECASIAFYPEDPVLPIFYPEPYSNDTYDYCY